MGINLSRTKVAIVAVEPLESAKIQAMLSADASVPSEHILVEQVFEAFEQQLEHRTFDVIILGLFGTDSDDFERLRHLSVVAPATAIIVATDREDMMLAAAVLAAGAQDVIVKRFVNGMSLTKALVQGMERARMRAELRAANQRLVRLNEEMNRFLGMAAHDLRGPIGTIGGFAELVLSDVGDQLGPDNIEALETIARSSKSMVRLIQELLDVSRIESGRHYLQLSQIDFKAFIEQVVRQNAKAARQKNIVIEAVCAAGTVVTLDIDKLTQVMDNLISNALKFSPAGTVIRVEGITHADGVEVRVQDSGPGISDAEIKQLFSPFFRGAARPTAGEQSTGLGLPIVKGIVTEHRGQVGVKSDAGVGATFWFKLPQSFAESAEQTAIR